ncbi:MAG: hypothetical protein R3E83_15195 [Burkholderiaceae bacterium]
MTASHVKHPARKRVEQPVCKNAKSVWAKAIAALIAVTISGCGDWHEIDPALSTNDVAAASLPTDKEVTNPTPPLLSKANSGAVQVAVTGVTDKSLDPNNSGINVSTW